MSDEIKNPAMELSDEELNKVTGGNAIVYVEDSTTSTVELHRCFNPEIMTGSVFSNYCIEKLWECRAFKSAEDAPIGCPRTCENCTYYARNVLSRKEANKLVNSYGFNVLYMDK